jgi:hypothetical protein
MLENRMLRRIFELKKEEMTGDWKSSIIVRNLINCVFFQILLS